MTKQIKLDSMFTPYTIDTYQAFTMDNTEDMIIQDRCDYDEDGTEREESLDLNYDDLEWEYDMKGFVQALANRRLEVLKDNIIDDVILDIKSDGPAVSPKEYNFKTDDTFEVYTVDIVKLNQFISDNFADYQENKIKDGPGFMWFGDDDQTKLNYYLFTKSDKEYSHSEQYYYDMVEGVDFYEFVSAKLKK